MFTKKDKIEQTIIYLKSNSGSNIHKNLLYTKTCANTLA